MLLNAYALLEIDWHANPAQIHRAYRVVMQRQHVERIRMRLPEDRASDRLAAIHAAYAMIQDAPLRHHPIGRASSDDQAYAVVRH